MDEKTTTIDPVEVIKGLDSKLAKLNDMADRDYVNSRFDELIAKAFPEKKPEAGDTAKLEESGMLAGVMNMKIMRIAS